MKKTLTIVLVITVLVAGLFILTGCNEEKTNTINTNTNEEKTTNITTENPTNGGSVVGVWKNDNTLPGVTFTYTFNADGTGKYDSAGTIMPFTYKTDGNKISIKYDGDTVSFDTTYSVNGNILNVKDSSNNDTLYTKVEETTESATTAKTEDTFDWSTLGTEDKIKHAIFQLYKNQYGDKLASVKTIVNKVYTLEEVAKNEALKTLDIKETDYAFEVSISLEPAEGADANQFTITDGVYDKESGWVGEIGRLGILRYDSTNKTYKIDNFGTGW